MPKAWSSRVLPSGATSVGQAVRSGKREPSVKSATPVTPAARVDPTDASLAHAFARAAATTSSEFPAQRDAVPIIVLLVCGARRVDSQDFAYVRLTGLLQPATRKMPPTTRRVLNDPCVFCTIL